MLKTSVADAKARLSEYLERAERGERIVICRHNRPVAELRAVDVSRTEPRPLGPLPGRPVFEIPGTFFEPLSDGELEAWSEGSLSLPTPARPGKTSRASRAEEKRATYGQTLRPGTRNRRSRS